MSETRVGSINDYGMCDDCKRPNTGYKWCNQCNAERFKNDFVNWSSDNEVIDGFIQETQLKANDKDELIEWIPFEKFTNVEYLTKGGFGKVFKATWTDGFIKWWDRLNQKWIREDVSRFPGNDLDVVCLKSIDNSAYVTREFFQEIENQLKFRKNDNTVSIYGITKDPKLKDYMLVLEYARKGSLRKMLDQHFKELGWEVKLKNLLYISDGLSEIHKAGLVHKDFHSGNIVMSDTGSSITDFGLCKPLLQDSSQKNKVFGVLPYVAPEVLRGKNYTQASDVYSFGIIMMEVITGFPPFYDFPHDENLAISICEGLRPTIGRRIPQLLSNLIDQCLDADPTKRLSSEQLKNTLGQYYKDVVYENNESIICKQVESCPSYDPNYDPGKFSGISYVTHPEAIYTSRLLSFGSLPNPSNINTSMAETKQLELVIPNFLEDMTNTSEEDEV